MSAVLTSAGETAPETVATPAADSGRITPDLAASLPYDELKARMRQEAREYEDTSASTEAPADDQGDQPATEAVTSSPGGPERDPDTGRFAASPSTDGQTATDAPQQGRSFKQPETLEEALRVLDSVRGNLNTNISERNRVQQRVQELEAEAARLKQEREQIALAQQHQRFESLVSRLPEEQQPLARAEYVQRLQQQAMGDYAREVQAREQQLAAREFEAAKSEVPSLYKDIATFVANQYEVPTQDLAALVDTPQVKALIQSAQTPEALQQATIAFGQLLDLEATRVQMRTSTEKAQRRETRAQTQVRDVPSGVTPGGAQEDVISRINNLSRTEFEAYKKRLLKAANR